jgi:transcriptional regulator with XRE-family HTH domain
MNDTNSATGVNPDITESQFIDAEISASELSEDKLKLLMSEKSEATIRRALGGYEIGRKIRQLRLRKKIGLVDLGKHTGLSASMLSQLENGKLIPTLPTLARIAMVFDVGVDHFFGDRKRKRLFAITRAAERIKFPERADTPSPSFFFECLAYSAQDKSLQAYLAEFPRLEPKQVAEHFHDGAEFLFMVEGTIEIAYQDESHELKPGDCVYFDSSEPHSYRGTSPTPARAIVITTPPRL